MFKELQDVNKEEVWTQRPGRSIAEQGQKGIAACRKLKGYCRVVDRSNLSGNPSAEVRMKCAIGLLNDTIKSSHFYDVMRNPNYIVGKQFPFPETFRWLDKDTNELDPVEVEGGAREATEDIVQCQSNNPIESLGGVGGPISSVLCPVPSSVPSSEASAPNSTKQQRPKGTKAAKAAKKRKVDDDIESAQIKEALENWTSGFAAANQASLEVMKEQAKNEERYRIREVELKEEASELEALKLLFSGSDDESVSYRAALRRKRLNKLLGRDSANDKSPTPP